MTYSEARRAAGLTQEKAAKLIGVSTVSLSLWERGKIKPRAEFVPLIAEAYSIDPLEAARLTPSEV